MRRRHFITLLGSAVTWPLSARAQQQPTIGILHSGSRAIAQGEVDAITDQLKTKCKKPPKIVGPDWTVHLMARAKSLIQQNVDVIVAAAGSRVALAAINARGSAKRPIIVFTTVAAYVLDGIDLATTTGVCAYTSDHDADRLDWLLKILQINKPKIGVLYNSNRGVNPYPAIAQAANGRCDLVPADINRSLTVPAAIDLFQQNRVNAILVAADRFFFTYLKDVIADYPAIYQWSEFVAAGGLMSFGANRGDCYDRATQMASDINDGNAFPPIYKVPVDNFELVVSASKADYFGKLPLPQVKLPLPQVITGDHRYRPAS